MLPEKSNHARFSAGLVPRAEAATFPVTGSSMMVAAVAAPEHRAMKTAALQQVFKLTSPGPISLAPHTHELSLSLYRKDSLGGQEQTLTPDNPLWGSRELQRSPPSGDCPSNFFSLTPYLAFHHEEDLGLNVPPR